MRKIPMPVVLPVVLMAGAAWAQQTPRASVAAIPWWDNRLAVTSLNLSEAQTKQLNQIQQSYVNRLRDLRAAVLAADRNLEEVFNEPAIDELKAGAAVDQYANARDNMTRELTHMSLAMRNVLTAEQWQQLVSMQNNRGGRGGRGRGRAAPVGSAPASGSTANKVAPSISQK
jgi:Spy/CpxP family protein refolding chaperone